MRKIAVRLAASFDHERGRETEGKLFGHESLAADVCLPNRPVTLARNAWNVKEKEEKERTDEETVRKHASKKPPRQLSGRAAGAPTTSAASGGPRRREQKARDDPSPQ